MIGLALVKRKETFAEINRLDGWQQAFRNKHLSAVS